MSAIIKWAIKTVVGRWVTGLLIASLLGGGAWKWYDFKDGLREEGVQECVQEINEATMEAMEQALEDERAANVLLLLELEFAANVNAEAEERHRKDVAKMTMIEAEMRTQRETDETYREWSDTDLPSGVADRLREAAGSTPGNTD